LVYGPFLFGEAKQDRSRGVQDLRKSWHATRAIPQAPQVETDGRRQKNCVPLTIAKYILTIRNSN
jgi:hypothetical protein